MTDNPYLRLTREFNEGKTRAIICSGQAVVLHGLAVMSKDGDWILRENEDDLDHILGVLERHGARYRFGAPLALPWMRMGWSSHLEFQEDDLRIRTDFFTRPPRLTREQLAAVWTDQEAQPYPVTDLLTLARLKLTNRERDYAVIGEIARRFDNSADQLLWSRSARDLIGLAGDDPTLARTLAGQRPLLASAIEGNREQLEEELDRERRRHIRANEQRLEAMQSLMADWRAYWPDFLCESDGLLLRQAHRLCVKAADRLLPRPRTP